MDRNRWKQIDEVLDAVLKLEPHERAPFLDQVCAGDEELRKKVEALVASDEEAGSFIQVPVLDPDASYLNRFKSGTTPQAAQSSQVFSLLDSVVRSQPELHPRQTITGRYELIARLGAGGMGEVWHAYDMKL